jgi:hypothetical protein
VIVGYQKMAVKHKALEEKTKQEKMQLAEAWAELC